MVRTRVQAIRVRLLLQVLLLVVIFLLACLPVSCRRVDALKLGYVGSLTGRYSDLGVSGRDGVLLAIEERNRAGGVAGRQMELLTRDDRQDAAQALEVDRELIEAGVVAIFGHMTSEMSMSVLPLINERTMVMISPTTATTLLSGKKDFFFRVYEPVQHETHALAENAIQKRGMRRVFIIYDLGNRAFAENYAQLFQKAFQELGGQVSACLGVAAYQHQEYARLVSKIQEANCDGVLLILNAMDTAIMCQQLHLNNWQGVRLASSWSMTQELVDKGAAAVEGIQAVVTFIPQHPGTSYNDFRKAFQERFHREPDFPTVCGYEAAQLFFLGYERSRTGGPALADVLSQIESFPGLQGHIQMDVYGDALRTKYWAIVRNHHIEVEQ